MGQDQYLPAPVVPAQAYDERYYREISSGSDAWSASEGSEVAGIYQGIVALRVRIEPGDVLVDLGTGRGELLVVALEAGASQSIGFDYSPAALILARRTLEAHSAEGRASVALADLRSVPLPDASADVVTSMEVVEHMAPAELEQSLREAYRILRPGGRIVIRTAPNRTVYDVTYRLLRLARPSRWSKWPADPRGPYEKAMHVNEQTLASMRRVLRRTGFRSVRSQLGLWVNTKYVPDAKARRTYRRLARVPWLRRLAVTDIWAEARRP